MGFFFAPFCFSLVASFAYFLYAVRLPSGCISISFNILPFYLSKKKKKIIVTFWGLPGLAGCFLWCFLVCSVFVVLLCCTQWGQVVLLYSFELPLWRLFVEYIFLFTYKKKEKKNL